MKNKKVKEIKKLNRDQYLRDIRQHGASEQIPKGKIFRDRKKHQEKYRARGPLNPDDA
jgi:hypothetical protein